MMTNVKKNTNAKTNKIISMIINVKKNMTISVKKLVACFAVDHLMDDIH